MQQLNIDVISNRNVGIVFHDDLNICEPHSHTFFELAYIISGNAIHTLNGKSDVVKSGEYVFIEPGNIHFFEKTNQQEKLTIINCIFTPEFIYSNKDNNTLMGLLCAPFLNIDTKQITIPPASFVYHDDNNQILNILNILQTEYSNKMSNYYLVMKNLIYSIMILSSRQVSSKEVRMVSPTELIKDYVSLHYSEHNILDQISETSYYSKQYLSSRFKSDTGLTFKSYLQQVMCGAAEHLMNCTNMSIPEISEAVGYNDIKYFQNIFKKHNGVSPKQLKMHFNKINNRKNES